MRLLLSICKSVYGIWRWSKQWRTLQLCRNKQTVLWTATNKQTFEKKHPSRLHLTSTPDRGVSDQISPIALAMTSKRGSCSDVPQSVCVEIKASFQPLHGLLVFRGPVEMKQQAHDFTAICFAWHWWRTSPPLTIQLPSDLFFLGVADTVQDM